MKKSICILLLLFPALFASASQLSLTSTNDYMFVNFMTNCEYDIQGIGIGPNGTYSIPRREDILFLAEAMRERRLSALSMIDPPGSITSNSWRSGSWNVPTNDYASIPQYMDNTIFYDWHRTELFGTNAYNFVSHRMVCPTNFITRPVVLDYTFNEYAIPRPGVPYVRMFNDGCYPVSRKLCERMENYERVEANLFPSLALYLGYMTNAYQDVMANTATLYFQKPMGSANGWSLRQNWLYDEIYHNYGYNFTTHSWYDNPLDDVTNDSTGGSPYSNASYAYVRRMSSYKVSKRVFKDGSTVSQLRYDTSSGEERIRTHTAHLKFPALYSGAVLNGPLNVFALLRYSHKTTCGTNVVFNLEKTLIVPTSMDYVCTTDEGYQVYRERSVSSSESYYDVCSKLLNDEYKDSDELLSYVEYPGYPETKSSSGSFIGVNSSEIVSDDLSVELYAYIGAVDITFHARVIE